MLHNYSSITFSLKVAFESVQSELTII